MPSTGRPPRASPIRVPNTGIAARNALVPSIGSRTQDMLGPGAVLAELLADDPVAGISRRDHLAQTHLHGAIDLGDRGCVRLAVDDAASTGRGTHDRACGIGKGMRELDEFAPDRLAHGPDGVLALVMRGPAIRSPTRGPRRSLGPFRGRREMAWDSWNSSR